MVCSEALVMFGAASCRYLNIDVSGLGMLAVVPV